jgi:hypothetical protein
MEEIKKDIVDEQKNSTDNPKPITLSDEERKCLIESVRREVRDEIGGKIIGDIRKHVLRRISWIFGIILAITGGIYFVFEKEVTLPKIYRQSEQYIISSITQKFAEPNIQNTMRSVASKEAKSIIEEKVNPAAENAKQQITSFQTYLSVLEKKYEGQYLQLAQEVGKLENRNRLLELADDAITNGNRLAYDKLVKVADDPKQPEAAMVASTQRFQVKIFYISGTRLKGAHLRRNQSDGSQVELKDDDVSTKQLIELLNAPDKGTRAVAANILRTRKEKDVPDALLETAKIDDNLNVMKEALQSFDTLTGYDNPDIFGYDFAAKWWEENKSGFEAKLKEAANAVNK